MPNSVPHAPHPVGAGSLPGAAGWRMRLMIGSTNPVWIGQVRDYRFFPPQPLADAEVRLVEMVDVATMVRPAGLALPLVGEYTESPTELDLDALFLIQIPASVALLDAHVYRLKVRYTAVDGGTNTLELDATARAPSLAG